MSALLIFTLVLILLAEFVNGWTDAPNAIVTVVSTKVLTPRSAVIMATILNTIGVMSGTAVAHTIGKGIIDPEIVNLTTIASAVVGVIVFGTVAAQFGIPTSESHALVAGLAGAGLATAGPDVLLWSGWQKVFIGIVLSSVLGFGMSAVIATIILRFFSSGTPQRSKRTFDRLQVLSSVFMAFNHGMNDGQKFMGVFTLALVIGGVLGSFHIPLWVILLCAGVMGLGTSVGGWKIIRKIGMQMVELKSWQGFSAETAAGLTIFAASTFGIPLSTTHTITTSIMGVGAARHARGVRWDIVQSVIAAWLLTFPVCGAIAFLSCLLLKSLFG
ncbi:inorganic phosphate transporter [Candidatus Poribacteria bacterium]|nr:inorganic phosphate transporter [Candidatus Poribacteria bacterium]